MPKLLMFKSLPAAGKSTKAKEIIAKSPANTWKMVEKDCLRAMLDNSIWSKGNEKFVLQVRNQIIRMALLEGKNVISSDTNLHPKHEEELRAIADECEAEFEVEFLDVPVEECIARDLKRANSVGEQVIRKMFRDYLQKPVAPMVQDHKLPHIILVDLDGTIAKMNGKRGPFEWNKVDLDDPNWPVINLVNVAHLGDQFAVADKVIFMSGRDEICREKTIQWLEKHFCNFSKNSWDLYMRARGDNRSDVIVKRELFDRHIRDKYYVEFILDDRDSVISLWRRDLGLPCFQVDYGDF